MVSEEPIGNELVVWVENIQHHIGVAAMRCGENHHFVQLTHFLEEFYSVRPDVYSGLMTIIYLDFIAVGEQYFYFVIVRNVQSLVTMN